jgi:hypothetical protein
MGVSFGRKLLNFRKYPQITDFSIIFICIYHNILIVYYFFLYIHYLQYLQRLDV